MTETWFNMMTLKFCGRQTQLSQNLLLLLKAHLQIKLKLLQLTLQQILINLQPQLSQLIMMWLFRMLELSQHKLQPLTLQKMLVKI
jgi:hypothetical protein